MFKNSLPFMESESSLPIPQQLELYQSSPYYNMLFKADFDILFSNPWGEASQVASFLQI
jgi:hypothetical protein